MKLKTENNTHYFEVGNIIENIKATTPEEQAGIKDMIVKIDFHNGDVVDYFRHLAQALAENYDKQQEQANEEKQEEQIEETKEQEIIAEKLTKEISIEILNTLTCIQKYLLKKETISRLQMTI